MKGQVSQGLAGHLCKDYSLFPEANTWKVLLGTLLSRPPGHGEMSEPAGAELTQHVSREVRAESVLWMHIMPAAQSGRWPDNS